MRAALTRVHVNQHVIAANKKTGDTAPAVTVKRRGENTYCQLVTLAPGARMVYRPGKPLSCGARAWLESLEPPDFDAALLTDPEAVVVVSRPQVRANGAHGGDPVLEVRQNGLVLSAHEVEFPHGCQVVHAASGSQYGTSVWVHSAGPVRVIGALTVRALTDADTAAVTALLDQTIGVGYAPAALGAPLRLGAWKAGVLAGIATARLTSVDDYKLGGQLQLTEPVGELKTCAVAPEYRGAGIASDLTRRRIRWLRSQGAQTLLSTAWEMPDGRVPAHAHLLASGLEPRLRVPGYWNDVDACLVCKGPCRCPAVFYVADLPSGSAR